MLDAVEPAMGNMPSRVADPERIPPERHYDEGFFKLECTATSTGRSRSLTFDAMLAIPVDPRLPIVCIGVSHDAIPVRILHPAGDSDAR